MPIPDYQSIMKPLLQFLKDHPGEHRMQDIIEAMAEHYQLSETEREEKLPSGQQHLQQSRLGKNLHEKSGFVGRSETRICKN